MSKSTPISLYAYPAYHHRVTVCITISHLALQMHLWPKSYALHGSPLKLGGYQVEEMWGSNQPAMLVIFRLDDPETYPGKYEVLRQFCHEAKQRQSYLVCRDARDRWKVVQEMGSLISYASSIDVYSNSRRNFTKLCDMLLKHQTPLGSISWSTALTIEDGFGI